MEDYYDVPSYLLRGNDKIKIKDYNAPPSDTGFGTTLGYTDIGNAPKTINFNRARASEYPEHLNKAHETVHTLQGGPGYEPADVRYKHGGRNPGMTNYDWDVLTGSDTPFQDRADLVTKWAKAAPYLANKYGFKVDNYFDPEAIAQFGKESGGRIDKLLFEQLATLNAHEAMNPNMDLVNDPYIRKHVLDTPALRETYTALSNNRLTRTDSKDLPSKTRITESPIGFNSKLNPSSPPTYKGPSFIEGVVNLLKKK